MRGEHAGGEVLGDRVGDRDELAQDLLAAFLAQVDGDPELLDVVIVEGAPEVDAAPVVEEGRHPAQDVPGALAHRILDPDHLGAERGEELGGAGAGELAGEVADPDVRERSRPRRRQGHFGILRKPLGRGPPYTPAVTAEFVWMGESLVVMSGEEAEELRRELSEPPKNPRRRPSDAEVVKVNPEYL